ncbi:MAG: universal stress protein [Deltaproteobacteria bacterium]|nr:universal stress protein [Deltaproteobacteria bacterium]
MHTRMLVPLDGSKVAEQVLPYARFLAKALAIPVELLEVIDSETITLLSNPKQGHEAETVVSARMESNSRSYLEAIARSFEGVSVKCFVARGKPEELIIDKAAADKETLIAMSTHGRSGIQRWLLGSVADKVIRGATNHVLLIRASDEGKTDGEAVLNSAIVPLDGSPLAEKVLPYVEDLARKMKLKVILIRAYALPPAVTGDEYGTYTEELIGKLEAEAGDYLAAKVKEIKRRGIENVSSVVDLGYGAAEIITLARKTPDNLIAMCTHGRSGIKRWVLGSVTERVVLHSGDPVLIIRAS